MRPPPLLLFAEDHIGRVSRRPLEVPSHAEAEEAAEEAEKEELLLGCILADAADPAARVR